MKMQMGNFITVPTETVEGFAVRLDDAAGIQALIAYKERDYDSGKIFTLVPEDKAAIAKYALLSPLAQALITRYLPGELTLILPKNPAFHHFYYDHFDTIGIRLPSHPLFVELLRDNGPLILTSANKKGGTPRSTAGHLPSTIIDLTGVTPRIVRQGNLQLPDLH